MGYSKWTMPVSELMCTLQLLNLPETESPAVERTERFSDKMNGVYFYATLANTHSISESLCGIGLMRVIFGRQEGWEIAQAGSWSFLVLASC